MSSFYIVATPIGNLEDITLRALRILGNVDLVLCEDTRVTRKLLDHYEIETPTMSYHQHSGGAKVKKIISLLEEGKDLALVTDAGTPGVSDPGNELVSEILKSAKSRIKNQESRSVEAIQELPKVISIPGASALTSALSVAGIPVNEFVFLGFLPQKKGKQKKLQEIVESDQAVVFYESKHRILKTLEQLSGLIESDRQLVVFRELTKKFETVYRGNIEEVLEEMQAGSQKGEYVVVVGGR